MFAFQTVCVRAVQALLFASLVFCVDAKSIPGKYIIQLKADVSSTAFASHQAKVQGIHTARMKARSINSPKFAGIEQTYQFGTFNAYAAAFDDATIKEISKLPEVLAIESDSYVYPSSIIIQPNAPWGLGSISHRQPGSTDYAYDPLATIPTYAYVIDTGIRTSHQEFEGRASFGYNAVPSSGNSDGVGHGTHLAGTIGGKTYGVAKKARLIAVKVFDNTGSGTVSAVLSGYNWAVNDIVTTGRVNSSVLNLSLSGAPSAAFDNAVNAAYAKGVLTVTAAGNGGQPAGNYSPGRVANALTVGAILQGNQVSPTSNYGPLVDIFAAGSNTLSAWYTSDTATATLSGTSSATAHVSGLVCYLRALEGPSTAAAIVARIIDLSTKNVLTGPLNGSPNRLAYNGSGL